MTGQAWAMCPSLALGVGDGQGLSQRLIISRPEWESGDSPKDPWVLGLCERTKEGGQALEGRNDRCLLDRMHASLQLSQKQLTPASHSDG